MDIDWDTTAVVGDLNATICKKNNIDLGAVTSESFINCVIDDFVDQMMETAFAGGTDIHSRAFTDRLKAF